MKYGMIGLLVLIVSATASQAQNVTDTIKTHYTTESSTFTETQLRTMNTVSITVEPKEHKFFGWLCSFGRIRKPTQQSFKYLILDYELGTSPSTDWMGMGLGFHVHKRRLLFETSLHRSFGPSIQRIGASLHKTVLRKKVAKYFLRYPLLRLGAELDYQWGMDQEAVPSINLEVSLLPFGHSSMMYVRFNRPFVERVQSSFNTPFSVGFKYHFYRLKV